MCASRLGQWVRWTNDNYGILPLGRPQGAQTTPKTVLTIRRPYAANKTISGSCGFMHLHNVLGLGHRVQEASQTQFCGHLPIKIDGLGATTRSKPNYIINHVLQNSKNATPPAVFFPRLYAVLVFCWWFYKGVSGQYSERSTSCLGSIN